MSPIITSILDNDSYKIFMMNAVSKLYPDARVRYRFINRGGTTFPKYFDGLLQDELNQMEDLYLTDDEFAFLKASCPFLDDVYLDLLRGYRYDADEVEVSMHKDGHLYVDIEGPWYRTILWEVPLMAMISELYVPKHQEPYHDTYRRRLTVSKARFMLKHNMQFTDFGTRRRASKSNHEEVIKDLLSVHNTLIGSSNVKIAMDNGIKPMGTQAHEWIMWHAAKYGFTMANNVSLGRWVDVYGGNLGIALTDTFGSADFFKNFDLMYSKLYDGIRHDSGCPFEFGYTALSHYGRLGIDPKSKTLVFSDGLTCQHAHEIHKAFSKFINVSFGIGTHLTNNVGTTPLNIVVKMTEALIKDKWVPTIKLSDVEGKETGDPAMIDLAKRTLGTGE